MVEQTPIEGNQLTPQRRFFVGTIYPEAVRAYINVGLMHKAAQLGCGAFEAVDLRNYAVDKRGSIDDRPYGGGPDMVMRPEPLSAFVEDCRRRSAPRRSLVVFPTPGGLKMTQTLAADLLDKADDFIFVCGRFEGVDQRFIDYWVDVQVSLGEFVVSGGELPSLMVMDTMVRYLPGVLNQQASRERESYGEIFDNRVEHPQYTRPQRFAGHSVPAVLLEGDHSKIAGWRRAQLRQPMA